MLDDADIAADSAREIALTGARQQIEYLRREYALATDLHGLIDNLDAQAEGMRIYHRVFTPDAAIRVTRDDVTLLSADGPDGWADVARSALHDYATTQHLIGTQIVTFERVAFDAGTGAISVGTARMSSYQQATHVWPDRRMRLVLGTYHDRVRWESGSGWQIEDMTLAYTSEEFRRLGADE